jgi:hypothetical protein
MFMAFDLNQSLYWYACKFGLKRRKKYGAGHPCIISSSGTWLHQIHTAHSTTLNRSCRTYCVNWKRRHSLSPWNVNAHILFGHSTCYVDHFMKGAHHINFIPMLYALHFGIEIIFVISWLCLNFIVPKHFVTRVASFYSSYSWFN